ncbi:MAG: hypothetical protein HY077_05785 [Elusimicrobia bacterium]|nr:hypothetical protein [Elusimicrobiota bacterium]
MSAFSTVVRELRAQKGYASARAFFKARGGPRFFGCTYKAYLNVEAGRSLPQPGLAMSVARGLSLDGEHAASFVSSYLRTAAGSAELASFLTQALAEETAPGAAEALLERASEESLARRARPMTREQAEILYSQEATYWSFCVISNDRGHWGAEEVAKLYSWKTASARRSLDVLVKCGLAARDRAGRYFCPDVGKVFQYPRDKFFVPRTLSRLKAHWDAMARRRGRELFRQAWTVRGDEDKLRAGFPHLAQAVYGAAIYSRTDRAADSAIFVVETRVRRLAQRLP